MTEKRKTFEYVSLKSKLEQLSTLYAQDSWLLGCLRKFLASLEYLDIFTQYKWLKLHYFTSKKYDLNVLSHKSDNIVDGIVFFKLIFASSILVFDLYNYTFFVFLTWYLIGTTFLSLPVAILSKKNRKPVTSYIRATVLGVFNYLELVFHFASLYLIYGCLRHSGHMGDTVEKIHGLYFSFITVSTIGYGNFEIVNTTGYVLVIIQAFIFLMFLLIFFSINLNQASEE